MAITTTGSGNWNSTTPNAPWPGGTVPSSSDTVTIADTHAVIATENAAIANFIIASGGTFTINSTKSFQVTGNITKSSTGNFTNNGTLLLSGTSKVIQGTTTSFAAGILTITGSITLSGSVTSISVKKIAGAGSFTVPANCTLSIINDGSTYTPCTITTLTSTASGSVVEYTGANAPDASGTIIAAFNYNILSLGTVNTAYTLSFATGNLSFDRLLIKARTTVKFFEGNTYTLANYTTGDWDGNATYKSILKSTTDGTHYHFTNPANMLISYANFRDFYASTYILAGNGTNTNSGGNTNFIFNQGTSALTLPKPTVAIAGLKRHYATSALTLPKPTVAASGFLAHTGYVGQTYSLSTISIADNTLRGIMDGNPVYDLVNFGISVTMNIRDYNNYTWNAVIKFNLAPLSTQKIISAKLTVNVTSVGLTTNQVRVSRLLRDWTEGSGDNQDTGHDSCWKYVDYNRSIEWTTKGARSVGNDYDKIYSTTLVSATGFKDFTGLKELVEAWLSTNNYGLMLWPDQTGVTSFGISSRQTNAGSQYIPAMTIEYATTQLPQITVSATGRVKHLYATSASTLPKPTLSSTGLKRHYATCTLALPTLTIATIGLKRHFATSALTLPVVTVISTGNKVNAGTSAIVLPVVSLASTGNKVRSASIALTLPQVQVTSTGHVPLHATIALTLPKIWSRSFGVRQFAGTVALTLPLLNLVSIATVIRRFGTGYITLPQLQLVSTGTVYQKVAFVAVSLPVLSIEATAFKLDIFGSVSCTLPKIQSHTEAGHYYVGTVELTLPVVTLHAHLNRVFSGTVALTLPIQTIVSTGTKLVFGSSALTLPVVSISAIGRLTIHGSITATLPVLSIVATGAKARIGFSQLTLTRTRSYTTGHRVKIVPAINLTLPTTRLVSIAHKVDFWTGTVTLTLPVAQVAVTAVKKWVGSSVLTLPILSIETTGIKHDYWDAFVQLTLPVVSASTIGKNISRTGSVALTLPVVSISSIGLKRHYATCALTLPATRLVSIGQKVDFWTGTVAITLPVVSVQATMVKILTGSSALTLPVTTVQCVAFNDTKVVVKNYYPAQFARNAGWAEIVEGSFADGFYSWSSSNKLELNFEQETVLNRKTNIVSITAEVIVNVASRFQIGFDKGVHPFHRIYTDWYLGPFPSTLTIGPITTNLKTGEPWSWNDFNQRVNETLEAGIETATGSTLAPASKIYLTVNYEYTAALPTVTLQATGIRMTTGRVAITLPQLRSQTVGHFISGHVAITLPSGFDLKAYSGMLLPRFQVSAIGLKLHFAAPTLTLPVPTVQATGLKRHYAVIETILPVITTASTGNKYNESNPVALTLPTISLTSRGNRVRIGTVTVVLPVLSLVSSGTLIEGVEGTAWQHFKDQITSNTLLNTFVKTWAFSRQARILKSSDMPFLAMYAEQTTNEEFRSLTTKFTSLDVSIHGKLYYGDRTLLRRLIYAYDELIKKTLEATALMNPEITIAIVQDSQFIQVSEYIQEVVLTVRLKTTGFVLGRRIKN